MVIPIEPPDMPTAAPNAAAARIVIFGFETMYNPKMPPFVSHFAGTDLIVRHIERYVCPTISSADVLGEGFTKFKADERPKILFLIGEREYYTRVTLPAYAEKNLTSKYRLEFWFAKDGENDFGNTPAMAKRMSELIPEAYVEILPGLKHIGLAENPQEFNSRLVPFLQDNL